MTNDTKLFAGIVAVMLFGAVLAVLTVAAGLAWWQMPQESRPITRIEPLPSLPTAAAPEDAAPPPPAEAAIATLPPTLPAATATAPPIVPPTVTAFAAPAAEEWPTRLEIPALNLVAPIVPAPVQGQSWQVDHLDTAVGHLQKTAAPGAPGNVVLAGHVSLAQGAPGPFAGLSRLSAGDVVRVVQGGQQFNFLVSDTLRVDVSAVEVTYPTSHPQLTLITCDGWNEAAGRYTARLVVKAVPSGK